MALLESSFPNTYLTHRRHTTKYLVNKYINIFFPENRIFVVSAELRKARKQFTSLLRQLRKYSRQLRKYSHDKEVWLPKLTEGGVKAEKQKENGRQAISTPSK